MCLHRMLTISADKFFKTLYKPIDTTIDVNTDLGFIIITTPAGQKGGYAVESDIVKADHDSADSLDSTPGKKAMLDFKHKYLYFKPLF